MSKIKEHFISAGRGSTYLLEWVDGTQYRYYDSFPLDEQLDVAKKIAKIENSDNREMMLDLLNVSTRLRNQVIEMKKEFETLHVALTKIDADIDKDMGIEPEKESK